MPDAQVPGQIMKGRGKYAKPQAQDINAQTVAGVQKRLMHGLRAPGDVQILMDAINRVRAVLNESTLTMDVKYEGDATQVVRVEDVYDAINQEPT